MEIEKSKVLIQFFVIFRQSGDVLFFLYARRLRGYTATALNLHDTKPTLKMHASSSFCYCCEEIVIFNHISLCHVLCHVSSQKLKPLIFACILDSKNLKDSTELIRCTRKPIDIQNVAQSLHSQKCMKHKNTLRERNFIVSDLKLKLSITDLSSHFTDSEALIYQSDKNHKRLTKFLK